VNMNDERTSLLQHDKKVYMHRPVQKHLPYSIYGATTFSITIFSLMTHSIRNLIVTIRIKTLNIIDLILTLSIKDTQHNRLNCDIKCTQHNRLNCDSQY